jgi:hypothetical protein
LEKWKLDQVALATLRTPKVQEESEDYWCNRVRTVAFEQVEQAADLGTMIHGALEAAMAGEPYAEDLRPYVEPVLAWKEQVGIQIVDRESRLVNKQHGFAGTADVLFRYGRTASASSTTRPARRSRARTFRPTTTRPCSSPRTLPPTGARNTSAAFSPPTSSSRRPSPAA